MKPILFNTEMVKAILDGRKTTTRRTIKLKYDNTHIKWRTDKYGTQLVEMQNDVDGETRGNNPDGSHWHKLLAYRIINPPYKKGDVLYVRETFYEVPSGPKAFVYKADETQPNDFHYWKPSIFMPKEAARIFLRVTDVKAERLQDITEDGAKAEGVRPFTKDGQLNKFAVSIDSWADYHEKHEKDFHGNWWQDMPKNPTTAFSYLWNSTVKKSGLDQYGWNANPWVWVISVERTARPNEK